MFTVRSFACRVQPPLEQLSETFPNHLTPTKEQKGLSMDTTPTPNKPLATYRDGKLKATLWQNENREGDTYYTVNLAKVYEDRNGKLQETSSFSDTEVLRVTELGKEARTHALHLKREHSLERKQQQSQERNSDRRGGGTPDRFQNRSEPRMER
ncbi:hypothetical protein [uncultured Roseobacter sp.]|uniref:hypothetical protein n=1 Tax=uncultured Roseobacter sp. TaxID=114847 RepID=UPI0026258BDF|nr:hypothetical protein [uncultured Roseobacter sp.]